ncbi:MAG: thiamine pyrophosphate-binding protein, partial [Alphaproteobacteria bacterium]
MNGTERSGAEHLVQALLANGVRRAFCVPGESYLPVLDALYDVRERIGLITCRHEAAAANMAEATGKLTGEPGIAFVTRGPGATHASIGVHTAFQDSSPMILFIGQVARDCRHREAFQEVDYESMFSGLAKWVARVDDAARLPEYVSRAFHTAVNGRPGPVVLELPEDMLRDVVSAPEAPRCQRIGIAPPEAALAELRERLDGAERPVAILGGGGWTEAACADFQAFAERANLPVTTSFRRKHLFDNQHPNYAGDVGLSINPRLAARLKEADVVLAMGARLGENPSQGYTLFSIPRPEKTLVHIHPGMEELGRVYAAHQMINATMPEMAAALAALEVEGGGPARREWVQSARADYEAFRRPVDISSRGVNLSRVFSLLAERLPEDAIITNGAGNYAAWLHRFYWHRRFATLAGPVSGAMGYGVPAALAAKAAFPERTVVCVAGDGCFLMSGQELATARQYGLNVIFLVVNNRSLGTIRMHQEKRYPG